MMYAEVDFLQAIVCSSFKASQNMVLSGTLKDDTYHFYHKVVITTNSVIDSDCISIPTRLFTCMYNI